MSSLVSGMAVLRFGPLDVARWVMRHLSWGVLGASLACSGQITIGLGPQDGGAGAAGAAACQVSLELQRVPVDLVFMLDTSLSMNEVAPTTGEIKWEAVSSAIKQFGNDPASVGMGAAVGFFAIFDQPNHISCVATDYAAPPVPMGTLTGQVAAIAAAVDGVEFETSASAAKTPMHVALQGAVLYARTWASQHLDHDVVVVLATDGAPNACDGTFDDVVAAATQGVYGAPSIKSFVIAILDPNAIDGRSVTLENQLSNLSRVAAAGLTGSAFVVDTTKTTMIEAQLTSALDAIRQSRQASCRFAVPATTRGALDIEQVIVRVDAVPVSWKRTALDCGTGDGYFYDDNASPTSVSLCDSSCKRIVASKSLPIFASGCSGVSADLRAVGTFTDAGTSTGGVVSDASATVSNANKSGPECLLNGQACGIATSCCSSNCCSASCSVAACAN